MTKVRPIYTILTAAVLLAGLLLTGPLSSAQAAGEAIQAIVVEGAERFSPDTVKSYLSLKEGDVFDSEKLRSSIKALYDTGFFKDVALDRQGRNLVVRIQENPLIYQLTFDGGETLTEEQMREMVRLKAGDILVQGKAERDMAMLRQALRIKGLFQAKVEMEAKPLSENRVQLVYKIYEGSTSKVREVRIIGNKHLTEKVLLQKLMIQPTGWLSWFTEDDTYDRDKLMYDQEQLREKYLNSGFVRVKVLSSVAELTPDRRAFVVTHTVEEGPRYTFGAFGIKGDVGELSEAELRQELMVRPGEVYSRDLLRQSIDKLTDRVGDLGYAFVDVNPVSRIDDAAKKVDVDFQINKGKRVYLNRVNIAGNTRTRDEVIRREMGKLVEGDVLSPAEVRKSKKRLEALDYFETVEISNPSAEEFMDRSDLNVKVEEKNTGAFTVGAGYSSYESFLGIATIMQNNFLGRGQKLKLSFALSSMRSDFEVSFIEPYFLNRNLALGVTVFNQEHQRKRYSSYNQAAYGITTFLGFRLSDRLSNNLSYTATHIKLSSAYPEAWFSPAMEAQLAASPYMKSMISDTLTWSKLDNPLVPSEGRTHKLTADLAGLGGDVHFLRLLTEHNLYHKLVEGGDLVGHVKARAGVIEGLGEDVPIFERFYLGGAKTVRGFDPAGMGPRTLRGDAFGGTWLAQLNTELLFPIPGLEDKGVRGLTFVDMGMLDDFDTLGSEFQANASLRMSAGVGVQWHSPFGPLQLHLAVPFMKEDYDKTRVFDFTIGTTM